MLSRRLDALVEAGLLERRRYCEHPPRHEYVPTARGRDFYPVLVSLTAWGNRYFAPEGASVLLIDKRTGEPADPILVDRRTGRPVTEADHCFTAGPAASSRTRARYGLPPRDVTSAKPGAEKSGGSARRSRRLGRA
jgi:hypothetical protein